jgi:mono/diheme cytochrome c family protein
LLRIFKWPDSVLLGTIGIPTIALVLLLAIPFIDLRGERRLGRRPVAVVAAILVVLSMGVLTYKGATAKEALGSELVGHVPAWAKDEGFQGNQQAIAGAKLFAVSGCLNCHIYNGDGGQNLGAPELTAEGAKNKGVDFQVAHLKCPACVNPGSPMPSFAGLGEQRLKQLASFLEASKGTK